MIIKLISYTYKPNSKLNVAYPSYVYDSDREFYILHLDSTLSQGSRYVWKTNVSAYSNTNKEGLQFSALYTVFKGACNL